MSAPEFQLRFLRTQIPSLAEAYHDPGEDELIAGAVAAARRKRYLDFPTFLAIGDWKSPRVRRQRESNPPEFVEEVTRLALAPSTSPRLAIESLTLLAGVSWPTASVILHLCHEDPYPIVDFRALWSLSSSVPAKYAYPFWEAYTGCTRTIARQAGVTMRTLDRALWQYSKVHQPAV